MSRGRGIAVLALLAVIGVIVAVVLVSRSPSKPRRSGGTTDPGAAVVRRRNLVVTDTETGTLSYSGSHTVYNRLSGTITWLPATGQLIKPGGVLYRVDNRPVLLLDGGTPAYRDP